MAASATAPSAQAQQIDPSVLGRIQGQLGANSSAQQLEDSRASGDLENDSRLPPQVGATAEELELRRQRSRVGLQDLYRPSPIETEFRQRTGDLKLRQFGYDLFRSSEGGAGALTGEVAGSYVLGVGDELVVSFQGATNDSTTARVDREGRLVVGQLRPIRAAGRSLASVRSELAAETRRSLLGTDVYVSLGAVRAISVFVGGEVERPGQYRLTSLGDVATALSRAGGIRRSGSLRSVRVIRSGGGSETVDLYGLLGIGTPSAVRLRDGDRIIVPVIGGTMAVAGSVARPAIYELRGPTTLAAAIGFAGGSVQQRGYKAAISRIGPDGTESFIPVSESGQVVLPGDAVQIVGGSAGGKLNRVMLTGYVLNPGPRPLSLAPTIHDLLGDAENLRAGTYLPMAILMRRDPVSSAQVLEAVNLVSALRDSPSMRLRSDDWLVVFSQLEIAFINHPAVRRIVLGYPNNLKKCRSLEYLEAVVRNTETPRFSAVTRGNQTVKLPTRKATDRAQRTSVGNSTALRNQDRRDDPMFADEEEFQPRVDDELEDEAPIDVRDTAAVNPGDEDGAANRSGKPIECPEVFEDSPEFLPVLIEHAVSVGGAVRMPGAYPIGSTATAATVVSVANGLTTNARDVRLEVIRAVGPQPVDQTAVPIGREALASVQLEPGDDLRVNAAQPLFESSAVLLSGEFNRPGLYVVRRGETLSQLIARAGGVTEFAYPYGAIFTRKRVKELQEEGFRRTARELNAGLLAAMARQGGEGGSLASATVLIDRLTSIEAPGRMVVETDPSVLAVRPELDTVLESGDAIMMPKTPNFVLALGDVSNPGALQFIAGKSVEGYLREAGGIQSSADDDGAFLVLPNGTAQPLKNSGWRRTVAVVPPGSTIIVPKEIDPGKTLAIIRDVATIFGQFATAIASIAILATQ